MIRPLLDLLSSAPGHPPLLLCILLALGAVLVGRRDGEGRVPEEGLIIAGSVPAVAGQLLGGTTRALGLFWSGALLLLLGVLIVRHRPASTSKSVLVLGLVGGLVAAMTSPAALAQTYGWVPMSLVVCGWVGFRARSEGLPVAGPVGAACAGVLLMYWGALAGAESALADALAQPESSDFARQAATTLTEEIRRKGMVCSMAVVVLGWAGLRQRPAELRRWVLLLMLISAVGGLDVRNRLAASSAAVGTP